MRSVLLMAMLSCAARADQTPSSTKTACRAALAAASQRLVADWGVVAEEPRISDDGGRIELTIDFSTGCMSVSTVPSW